MAPRAAVSIVALVLSALAHAADPATCAAEPELARLDFWIGTWDVCAQGARAGRDRISKVLGGCAVTEEWTASDGSQGSSLFYYSASDKIWKQVWVTDRALLPGGLKEKRLVARFADGGVRFQGEIALPDGRRILDRTTLRPAANGTVQQRIEISRDGGDSWTASFDAEYRPAPAGAGSDAGRSTTCR